MKTRFIPVAEIFEGIIPNPPEIIAVLWAYLDESGMNQTAHRMTVGGLVGRKVHWQEVERYWTKRLPDGIKVFHHAALSARSRGYLGIWTKGSEISFIAT